MTGRHTVDTINSDQLDQLYDERDTGRQHAAAIAAQRDRLRQRMNDLADRWDHALPVDKTYARTLRNEISIAPFDPDGTMTVDEYTERGRHLWAFRCWGTETCDGWLGLGHHTQTSALLERERHVAEAHGEPAPTATEQDATRVIDLYERWVKAGPPPLGVPMSRWWDARLVELRAAIVPPTDQTKEPPCTPGSPPQTSPAPSPPDTTPTP